jgi:metallo-beta-lactamase family protein
MHLEFHGAARTVTGSRHLLCVGEKKILLDCGLFQGSRRESERLNRDFGFDPTSVDAVVMSHAHIDHSGALPSLVKAGFRGAVHGTLATADLLVVMLRDSASIQERDAEYVTRRRARRGEPPVEPLYTMDDADDALALLEGHGYHRPVPILPGVTATFYDAGHILGSAIVSLEVTEEGRTRTLVFTGDLGRKGTSIIRDPETPPEADALIIESTYGNRRHQPRDQLDDDLVALVHRVLGRSGKLIVPAFAVGRTQELVFALSRLLRAGRIPPCEVFIDSPMAINVTEIFTRHPECFDRETRRILRETSDPFGFELHSYVRDVADSKALNTRAGPFIVVSASGMCESGRIRHHLANAIGDAKNCILIVGFQAAHTLGRRIVEGQKTVNIFGEPHDVAAEVVVMNEFSAHADRDELLAWVGDFRRKPGKAFVVHGEESQCTSFAEALEKEGGVPLVVVPAMGERAAMVAD